MAMKGHIQDGWATILPETRWQLANRPGSKRFLALWTGCAFIGSWAVTGRRINTELSEC